MSSWAKEKCYSLNFGGLLGKSIAVRRPGFEAWEGLGYFIPKSLDGEIVVALCLRGEDMENLKADSEFGKFGMLYWLTIGSVIILANQYSFFFLCRDLIEVL